MRSLRIQILGTLWVVVVALVASSSGQTSVWTSAATGNWSTGADWTGGLPGTTSATTIGVAGSSYTVTLNATEQTGTFTLSSTNATLLSSGYLELNKGGGASALTAGLVQMTGGGAFYYDGVSLGHTLSNSATIQSTGGTNYIYSNGGVGNGVAFFTNTGSVTVTSGTLYLGDNAGDSVTNSSGGTITANGSSAVLYLNGGTTSIDNMAGSTLTAVNGGTINIGGNFTSADLGGTINGAGGTLNLTGKLTNSGTLAAPTSGIYTLLGGTIVGGSVNAANSALTFSSTNGILNNVAMTGNFSLPANSEFTVENGTSFSGSLTFAGGNYVYLAGTTPVVLTIPSGQTWTDSGSLYIYAQVANLTASNLGTMNLAGGDIWGGGYTGFVFSNSGTLTNTNGSLTIGNSTGDVLTNTGTIQNVASGSSGSSLNIASATSASVTNSSVIETNATGTGSANMDIGDGTSSSVTNSGTILVNVSGSGYATGYLGYGSGSTVTNTGTGIIQVNGTNSLLYLGSPYYSSTWTNAVGGLIEATNGGTLDLGGTFANTTLTTGTINGSTGTINIVGTLNNSGTLQPPDGGGIFTLHGGTINGGTVSGTNSALTFSSTNGILNNVAMTGNFSLPANSEFTVENGTSFSGSLTFAGGNYVYLAGTTPVVLTIPSGQTWTDSGSLYIYAQVANLTASNLGTMNLAGGDIWRWVHTGFVFNNSGTLTNTNSTLSLGNYSADSVVNSGTINILSNGSNSYYAYVGDGSSATVSNTGTIEATTTGSGYASVYVGYGSGTSVTNTGTLEANGANSQLYLGYSGSAWTNTGGTIEAVNGGAVFLYGTIGNSALTSGTINGTGGVINLSGTLNNTGTLSAPNGGGVFTLNGGTINGGTVSSGALTFGNYAGTLNGVTMNGNFTLPASTYASFTASNNTTFTGGTTTFSNSSYDYVYLNGASMSTALTIAPSATWSGGMYIYNDASNPLSFIIQGVVDHIGGTGAYIYGAGNGLTVTNSGTIETSGGGSLVLGYGSGDTITNLAGGTIEANNSVLYLDTNSSNVTNFSGGSLTGGTWIASNGGTLQFEAPSSTLTTNAAGTTLVLSGSGSNILSYNGTSYVTLDQTLATNNGTLEVLADRNFLGSNAIVNNGTIQLGGGTFTAPSLTNGSGSTISGFGTLNPTGGVTIGNGVLVSPGSAGASSYVGELAFNSATLGSGGAYTFDVMNATGTAGTDFDTISVTGALTITATPALPFTVSVESINPGTGLPGSANFNLSQGYQWTLLSAGSISGFNASDFTITATSLADAPGSATSSSRRAATTSSSTSRRCPSLRPGPSFRRGPQ